MLDTIAALATPPVSGAVGIIRISGPKACKIAGAVFFPAGKKELGQLPPRELSFGEVRVNGALLDRGMAARFVAPYSYTGQDAVELHLHGSLPVLSAALDALYAAGARPARPGEFTRRAFLHGKLSLSQAEAVMDLITAETRDAARNAAGQLSGRVGRVFSEVYVHLSDMLANFYAVVDYPEQDIPDITADDMAETLRACRDKLSALLATWNMGRHLREGVRCAITGRPNVGKSSLLNAFSGFDRAIVSAMPGTTRDTVEETVTMGGVSLRLIDSAGIRSAGDDVESEGVRRARLAVRDAELVFVVLDGSEPLSGDDRAVLDMARDKKCIVLINKGDLPQRIEAQTVEAAFLHVCTVSAVTGEGLALVDSTIRNLFDSGGAVYDGQILTNARQADALRRTVEGIEEALAALTAGVTPDAVLSELERALSALCELTGRRLSEDVVNRIFERFCVGK